MVMLPWLLSLLYFVWSIMPAFYGTWRLPSTFLLSLELVKSTFIHFGEKVQNFVRSWKTLFLHVQLVLLCSQCCFFKSCLCNALRIFRLSAVSLSHLRRASGKYFRNAASLSLGWWCWRNMPSQIVKKFTETAVICASLEIEMVPFSEIWALVC